MLYLCRDFLGKGVYIYDDSTSGSDRAVNEKAKEIIKKFELKPQAGVDGDEDIQNRLLCRFTNEAIMTLQARKTFFLDLFQQFSSLHWASINIHLNMQSFFLGGEVGEDLN